MNSTKSLFIGPAGDARLSPRRIYSLKKTRALLSRSRRRLEAQSKGRKMNFSEYKDEVSEKENKTLINLCKAAKISVDQLKRYKAISDSIRGMQG